MAVQKPLPSSQSTFHLPQLEGVRGLAALYVIITHALTAYDFNGQHLPGLLRPLVILFGHGHSIVSLFIVLSGFCLMIPIALSGTLRGGASTFFKRRAIRILPTYYAALLLSILLGLTVIKPGTRSAWDSYLPITIKDVVTHVLLVHELSYDTTQKINGPFWSVAVECKIYLFLPLLVALVHRRGWRVVIVSAFFLSYFLVALFLMVPTLRMIDTQDFGMTPQYLFLFVLGMCSAGIVFSTDSAFAKARQRIEQPKLLFWTTVVMALTINSGMPLRLLHLPEVPTYIEDIFVGVWAALLLGYSVRHENGTLYHLLTWKPFIVLGTFGYSLYLMHQPVLQLVWQWVLVPLLPGKPLLRCLLLTTVGTLVAVGVCYGFYLVFEKPVARWRKKHKANETSAERNSASTTV